MQRQMIAGDLDGKRMKLEDLTDAEAEGRWTGQRDSIPSTRISTLYLCNGFKETYCIPLILDIWGSGRDLVCKSADVVAQISLIVDCVDNFTETARLTSLLTTFERADIQTIA